MNSDEEYINSVSSKIIGCAYLVHNTPGYGFAERVYANALAIELRKQGFVVGREVEIVITYDVNPVGKYYADMIVEGLVLVETKAVKSFDDGHTSQCLNYLAATKLPLCLLLNFGRKVEIKRLKS